MRKFTLLLLTGLFCSVAFGQQDYWSSRSDKSGITTDKAVARLSFPKEFKLFELNVAPLRQQLFSITDNKGAHSTIISLPNADGVVEKFEVFEASNFVPELQARFPEIRAFSGRGITDRSATLKLSISPQGIQTMVFRTNGPNEYIEPYSQDRTVYAVFKSQRAKGGLPWVCSTQDQQLAAGLNANVSALRIESNVGQLKTMRLAQSCNGEYSNFFGATSAAQVALVLAGYNATLTRCNGCYEKDLAIHLNLIANTDLVIFYDPATDPYTTLANWNNQLQATLTAIIGEANYDIGHMFGASGGGGNAGCIGCVCVDNQKGRGITSPADGIPQGDNFDIDYVAHEVGHQMGGNHTFSMSNEGLGQNKEVGSGITIMGYAGITAQDVAPHSIDIFHETSIQQIQVNMAGKTCPITINQAGINATPVVAALTSYTIPISTPFVLTGSASDADPGDVLTYCWEQNDDGAGQTGTNSVARENKPTGPNWLSFSPTLSPTRLMPRLSTILTGANITGPLPGGDAGANIEALSNVGRTLNFRLTARDNRPYNGTAIGQTHFQDMAVTVNAATGPFLITSQNAPVSYAGGSAQTVTWSVNGTTGAPINCANVMISFSTDGGVTFPTVLAASTANDGTESIVIPSVTTTTGRIKVEAIGNIFFDINNASITVTAPLNGFSFNSPAPVTAACPAPNVMTSGNLTATYTGTFTGDINLTGVVVPAGPTVSFSSATLTTVAPSTTVSLTGMAGLSPGNYTVTVTGVGVAGPTVTRDIVFTINPGSGPVIGTQPTNQTACSGNNATFTVVATGTYQWQVSTAAVPAFTNIGGATAASLTLTGVTAGMSGNQYRVIVTGQCGSTTSNAVTLTVNVAPAVTTNPVSQAVCSGSAVSFTAAGTGTPAPTFQWQVSTIAVPAFTNIGGATSATYTIAATTLAMNGDQYRCVLTNSCGSVNTTAATLTVNSSITISTNPVPVTVCEATTTSFTVAAAGSGLSYQWQVSVDGGATYNNVGAVAPYSGTTTPTLTITGVPPTFNGYRYR
ncbi:MAG: reprolysin-like metallopeptidase, partial [Chitinophagaceae bacterium]